MKLSTFLVSGTVLFSVTFARPSRFHERVATRQAHRARANAVISRNSTQPEFSENWSGVVLTDVPVGQTFTTVTGTFTVPTVSGSGSATAWVGIDGDTASQSILQSGVDFIISEGVAEYVPWFEWFPEDMVEFENFVVSAGDVIAVTVHSNNSTTGTVTLVNESTGESVTENVNAPDSAAALRGLNAEWIVEAFIDLENGSFVPFADFTPITFSGAFASTASETLSPSDGTVLDIERNNEVLTSVTNNGAVITVTRIQV